MRISALQGTNVPRITTDSGVDIVRLVTAVQIDMSPGEMITAHASLYVSDLRIEGARLVISGVDAPEEVLTALREFFKNAP